MALSNVFGWNKKDEQQTGAACGTACGASDKPAACGASDKPAACGTACGAGDKPAACGASDKPVACGTACGSQGPVDLGSEPTGAERRPASDK